MVEIWNERKFRQCRTYTRRIPRFVLHADTLVSRTTLKKDTIWRLLDVENKIGLKLTESRAMHPGCSVSGLYFSNPKSQYFNIGSIGKDQVEDYAVRKEWSLEKAMKWLRPNLNFE